MGSSPSGADSTGLSQRNRATQRGQYTRSLRPSMPLTKAVAHLSTEVVLFNGQGSAAAACMAGRSPIGYHRQHSLVTAELGGQRVQRGLVEIGQNQFGAVAAQPVSDLSPDSPGTARDDDDFAVQRCHGRQSTVPV